MAAVHIGTSGWSYPGWRSGFYAGVPQSRWLAHCIARFTGLEVNATFYRRPRPAWVERWRALAPAGFAFAVKGSKVVTHSRRLRNVAGPVATLRNDLAGLGPALAVVFWQLPPGLKRDDALLDDFLAVLAGWPDVRHAVEFRHASWFDDTVAARLADAAVANVVSDSGTWPHWDAVTTDLAYLRLHGAPVTYASAYGPDGLRPWAQRARGWLDEGRDVHIYFDNDGEGAAPYDALEMMTQLAVSPVAAKD